MGRRVEQKFRLTTYEALRLREALARKGMSTLFPRRMIESLYFDNEDMGMFTDSNEGCVPRKKIRIRTYPSSSTEHLLESKISSANGRSKTSRPLSPGEALSLTRMGILDPIYGYCKPLIYVRYIREYLRVCSARITIDHDIYYRRFQSAWSVREHESVAEIKAPDGVSVDFLQAIIEAPTSRFSKYSRACERLFSK